MKTSTAIAASFSGIGNPVTGSFRESGRMFDVDILPADLRRVYDRLEELFDDEYALAMVFTIRTAIELHRAWHVSYLTTNILQQIKDKFKLRMTWKLGVIDLTFRIEDGLYELNRRVPYDYDSEFQNMYFKTAVAFVEGRIGVHDALIFQKELKDGKHTCRGGLLLRRNPGRLILYPIQAATCTVIFFQGDWLDAGVAALCGLTAGLIEWALTSKRVVTNTNESKILIDFLVGLSTGIIGGLFFKFVQNEQGFCLRAIFLGTLYWFFYGTAFVIGLLEIIVGELQTGVTRFLAVSVKTFVLSVGSAIGLALVLTGKNEVYEEWVFQAGDSSTACDAFSFSSKYPWDPWWRIPLYILCSISVLGQYRFIILNYWAGLIVQVAAFVAQETIRFRLKEKYENDGMNTVFGDIVGAISAVAATNIVSVIMDYVRGQITTSSDEKSSGGKFMQNFYRNLVEMFNYIGIGRGLSSRSSQVRATLEEKSAKEGKSKVEIKLSNEEEATLIEEAVENQETNIWCLLMPAVYQLVPGSKLAMYWYNVIFPPYEETRPLQQSLDGSEISAPVDKAEFALWLTSVSLALGLILGLAISRIVTKTILFVISPILKISKSEDEMNEMNRKFRRQDMTHECIEYDPDDGIVMAANPQTNEGLRLRG